MSLKKVSNAQSSQAEILKNFDAFNSEMETLTAPYPKRKFDSKKQLSNYLELPNSNEENGIRVVDQKIYESFNNEDISILAFASIKNEDVKSIIELVKLKKMEAKIDSVILNNFFEILNKSGNLKKLEEKLLIEIKESAEIVKILNESLEIKNKINKCYKISENSTELANIFLNLLNYNNLKNSLELSGEGHDGKITTIISNLTSLPENQVNQFDLHTALWFLLSDISESLQWGVSPGYVIEQGKRNSNEYSAATKMKEIFPNLKGYKKTNDMIINRKGFMGDNTIEIIPNLGTKISALEKVAYYCQVISNELRYSVGSCFSEIENYFHFNLIGISNDPYSRSNSSGTVYDSLIFDDSKIVNNGRNTFVYADPQLEPYQNLNSFNFSKINYIDNFYSTTPRSPGSYNDFFQQLINVNNKIEDLTNYIKTITFNSTENSADYNSNSQFLNPKNLFGKIISFFFQTLRRFLNNKNPRQLMNFIIAKKLSGHLNYNGQNFNLINLKRNIQLKTVELFITKAFDESKEQYLKQSDPEFRLNANENFRNFNVIGDLETIKNDFHRPQFLALLNDLNPTINNFSVGELNPENLPFMNGLSTSYSDFCELIYNSEGFSEIISNIMIELLQECVSINQNSQKKFVLNGFTRWSGFDANTFIALLNECFYILSNEFVDLKWATYIEGTINSNNHKIKILMPDYYIDNILTFPSIFRNTESGNRVFNEVDHNSNIFSMNSKVLKLKEIYNITTKLEGEYEILNNLCTIAKSITTKFFNDATLLKNFNDKIDASNIINSENDIAKNAINFMVENKQNLYQDLDFIKVQNYKNSIDNLLKSQIINYDFAFKNQKNYDIVEAYLKTFENFSAINLYDDDDDLAATIRQILQKQNFKFVAVGLSAKSISEITASKENTNDFKINFILNKKNNFRPEKESKNFVLANNISINYELNFDEISSLLDLAQFNISNLATEINAFNFFTQINQKLPESDLDSNYKLIESMIISQLMHIVFGLELESKNIRLAASSYNKQIVDLIIKPLENVLGISDLTSKLFFEDYGRLKFRSKNEIYDLIYNSSAGSNLKDAEVQAIIDSIYTLFDSKICTTDLIKKTIFLNNVNEYSSDYYLSKILCFKVSDFDSNDEIFNSYAVSCEIS